MKAYDLNERGFHIAMANVLTFVSLPDEHEQFVEYLARTSDVWARQEPNDLKKPTAAPVPVAEYFARGDSTGQAASVGVYLGFREAVLQPPLMEAERIEGGTHIPFERNGKIVPGVTTITGGVKVRYQTVDFMKAELLSYRQGCFRDSGELSQSNLFYYSSFFQGQQPLAKSAGFLQWAKRVLDWMRRRTKASVPIARANYSSRCTVRVAEAHAAGLVVTY